MPSIFDDQKLAPHIVSLRCPPFDDSTVKAAREAQIQALGGRHKWQMESARRDHEPFVRRQLALKLRDAMWDGKWQVSSGPLLLADPSTLSLEVQRVVARLKAALPPELSEIVETALLSPEHKLALALAFEAQLVDYQSLVTKEIDGATVIRLLAQQHRGEQVDLVERLDEAILRWKKSQEPQTQLDSSASSPLFLTPSSTFNSLSTQPRYFRILVWNLENFTRDRRPRGAQPMDSMRNAARIAIVADVIARFKIDLLLMMETGTDVGTATTRIAGRVAEQLNERDGWDPFVSPPTGALPEVKAVYDDHSLGRPSGLKAVSLRTLFDVYVVTPRYDRVPTAVTGQQISDAWAALWGASPWASRFLRGDDVSAENSVVRGAPSFELLAHIVRRINDTAKQVGSVIGGSLEQDVDTVIRVMSDSVNELANGHLQTSASDLAYAILSARDAIDMLAEIEVEASFQQDIIDEGVAWLQAVELMALFLIKAASGAIPTSGLEGRVFRSDSSQGNRIPLAVFLCTGAGRVTLKARDRKQGPADGTLDNDVLLGALQRIGAVERHIETYGVVYRQPFPGATQALLGRGVLAHGFSGGVDEAAARYGIVQAPLSKGAFSVQQAGGLLNWRSALQITVPASTAVALPLVVYHTRYSGTAELKKYDTTLTAEENTILARCMSVEMMAAAVLPGDSKLGPPLIVGDFNVPDAFLNKQAVPVSKDKRVREAHRRRDELRLRFVGEMARRGYLRHSLAGKPDDGYPPTTLKAFSTITRGEDAGSEPYDGTYQPFDYGRGGASPSSGVVSVRGLLDGSVLQEKITGIPSQAADGRTIDPDAGEAEDTSKDVQDEDTMREDPSKDSEWTVGEAIAVEVGRVYRGILRRIYRAIEDLKPWMDAIHRKRPSDELIEKLREIGEVYTGFEQHVAKRVEWFARSCIAGETGTWLTASRSDSLVDWQKLFGDAAQLQERDEIRGGVAGLAELAGEVQVQLTALETQMEVRRLVAYRAVVSDHLPQIIEIDMQPA